LVLRKPDRKAEKKHAERVFRTRRSRRGKEHACRERLLPVVVFDKVDELSALGSRSEENLELYKKKPGEK